MVSAWDAMVKHALECDLSHHPELRSYKVQSKNVSLFFNCVDGLVGAEFNDVFVATDMFDPTQKVQTLPRASVVLTVLIVVI